nr:hypothetical protein [Kibdelosporangium sp. MJ126-NF4]CTQ93451.1 hypothetical protein [Kibdelosporangium sp. MJ126-NF4]
MNMAIVGTRSAYVAARHHDHMVKTWQSRAHRPPPGTL